MATNVEELAARLQAEAERRGKTSEQLLDQLAAQLPERDESPAPTGVKRHLAFASIGASTSGRTARETNEMLAEGFGQR